jgi:isopenicillin N synthase-like dioxygenase
MEGDAMTEQQTDPKATAFQSIPVIDIQPLIQGDRAEQQRVAAEIGKAAREVGFFQVVGHGLSDQLRQRLIREAERFFAQPEATKMAYHIGYSSNHRGYVPPGEESPDPNKRDVKEALDLAMELPWDDPDVGPQSPMLGPNTWPDLDGFRDGVETYYDATYRVGRELMRGFALALDLDQDRFLREVNKPPSQLRLIHYPYDPEAEDAEGVGAHTDYECFTLLLPTTAGLEVMNGRGEWIDVPYIEGALVVNIGDMLEIWTNGAFIATSHRVRKIKEERYSFPFFFACDYHTVVEPLPELVQRHGECAYRPLKAGDHLYAQTIQTFQYLQQRLARGEIEVPDGSLEVGSLGQHGRQKAAQ